MTLLPSEACPVLDGGQAIQALLIRSYLERDRRPPAARRDVPSVPGSAIVPHRPTDTGQLRRCLSALPARRPPAAVEDAMAFIEAHAGEPIGLAEIAAAARLSPRALQSAFRRHLGTTPLGHLRAVRLGRVHADLRAARPGDGETVSAAANRWGFSQLSRFARDYRSRYGVPPRQTLSRSVA